MGISPTINPIKDPATGEDYDPLDYPEINGGAGIKADLGGNEIPNSPHWRVNFGAEYEIPFGQDWSATIRGDAYWQGKSWARVYNLNPYDRLRSWTNFNLSLRVNGPENLTIEAYVKNVFNSTPITDAFLNSDDSGLTTNVFTLDPPHHRVQHRQEILSPLHPIHWGEQPRADVWLAPEQASARFFGPENNLSHSLSPEGQLGRRPAFPASGGGLICPAVKGEMHRFAGRRLAPLLVDDHRPGMVLVEMLADDPEIAAVRAEKEVEGVACDRDRAQRGVDAEVADHPPDLPLRHTQVAGFPDDIGAHRRGDDVADDGDEADDGVESDGAIDAGDDEAAFEQIFERLDPLAERGGGAAVLPPRGEGRGGIGGGRGHAGPFRGRRGRAPLYYLGKAIR